MWSEKSPLPNAWCTLAVLYLSGGFIAARFIGIVPIIVSSVALLILMYAANAVDLKLDKGQHRRR